MANGGPSKLQVLISLFAAFATGVSAWSAANSLSVNKQTLEINRATQEINKQIQTNSQHMGLETQKSTIFAQFQQQYSVVLSRFPAKFGDKDFRPAPGTDDYTRLEAYWLFCFSEWYATKRLAPDASGDLWTTYYSPLIQNGLEIPSLRYALEDIIQIYQLNRGDYRAFFLDIAGLARASGKPLSDAAENRLRKIP